MPVPASLAASSLENQGNTIGRTGYKVLPERVAETDGVLSAALRLGTKELVSLRLGELGRAVARVRLSALDLRRDPHGSVKQIHHEELEDGDKKRPSAFPKIMFKQADSGIQQLHGARERTQD